MNEILSRWEIEAKFADEWVLIGDPQTDPSLQVLGGTVLHHSKDRDEVEEKLVELRPKRFTILYLGTPPPDTAFALSVLGSEQAVWNRADLPEFPR